MPTTYMSWAGLALVYFPPILLCLITSIYAGVFTFNKIPLTCVKPCLSAGLALRWFMERRAQFNEVLSSSHSGLTTARYLRLMGLAICEMLAVLGLTLYAVVGAVKGHAILPYVSWNYVHSDFGRIAQYPLVILPSAILSRLIGCWYITPAGSVCFFAFFAFGEEALAEYTRWGRWVLRNIFRREMSHQGPLPSFIG